MVRWLAGGVAGPGVGLVPASPPRPAQPVAGISHGHGHQGGEQVPDLAGGQLDHPWRRRTLGVLGDRGHHQERVRQHGQGHSPVPAAPGAHLVRGSRPHSPWPPWNASLSASAPAQPNRGNQRRPLAALTLARTSIAALVHPVHGRSVSSTVGPGDRGQTSYLPPDLRRRTASSPPSLKDVRTPYDQRKGWLAWRLSVEP